MTNPRAEWGLKRLNRASQRLRSEIRIGFPEEDAGEPRQALIEEARDELAEIETEIERRGDATPTAEQAQDDMMFDQEGRAN